MDPQRASASATPRTQYPVTDETRKRLENNFTYHAPKNDQQQRYVELREQLKTTAYLIVSTTPPSREQSLALTALEEAMMWANASIARNE